MKLSFIVVTHDRAALLAACLQSIYNQQGLPDSVEIIIVDNGGHAIVPPSPVGAAIGVRVLQPGSNLGVTGGRNLGIEVARGELLCFIDDDAEWDGPDGVRALVDYMDAHPDVGALAVRSVDPQHNLIKIELPYADKAYASRLVEPTPAPHFIGVAHMLRASALAVTGRYPERFFYAMEEVDLSLRLLENGIDIVFMPAVRVIHHRSELGRPLVGGDYWLRNGLNRARVAWRLLPLPLPLTITVIWSVIVLVKTRRLNVVGALWRMLWRERALLRSERRPVRWHTVSTVLARRGRMMF